MKEIHHNRQKHRRRRQEGNNELRGPAKYLAVTLETILGPGKPPAFAQMPRRRWCDGHIRVRGDREISRGHVGDDRVISRGRLRNDRGIYLAVTSHITISIVRAVARRFSDRGEFAADRNLIQDDREISRGHFRHRRTTRHQARTPRRRWCDGI